TVGGIAATNIARWNGSAWSALGSGLGRNDGYLPAVFALAVSGNDVYAGGWFETAGGSPATNIAKWDGTAWSAMGPGLDDCFCPTPPGVYALAVSGNAVYAAGQFVISPNNFNFNVAKWDGSTWNAVGSGMDYFVNALAVSGSDVYVGGLFGTAGGVAANSIAKWDGSAWSALGSGLNGSVSALALSGSDLYVGGAFTK